MSSFIFPQDDEYIKVKQIIGERKKNPFHGNKDIENNTLNLLELAMKKFLGNKK